PGEPGRSAPARSPGWSPRPAAGGRTSGIPPKASATPARRLAATAGSPRLHPEARSWTLLEHDPEKWVPVFGEDHAPTIGLSMIPKSGYRFSAKIMLQR